MGALRKILYLFVTAALVYGVFFWFQQSSKEKALLKIIENLKAESRIAEVLVVDSKQDAPGRVPETTIKFLEYGAGGKPLQPKYFTFRGNVIQFQTLVVRFEDRYVEMNDALRGKSIALFLKVFVLDGTRAQVLEIAKAHETPEGYRVPGVPSKYQDAVWKRFWKYALMPAERRKAGIKNAQIEAPGSMFVPGTIYTIRIEHDGGVRIDANPIPAILKGERVR